MQDKTRLVFLHLPSVDPKQLCASAHLGCTREAGTSKFFWKKYNRSQPDL